MNHWSEWRLLKLFMPISVIIWMAKRYTGVYAPEPGEYRVLYQDENYRVKFERLK